ncbi:MAG: cytochrome c1 [Methylococcales bacterium]|jgi:ubiquinol-cytochrome c reductase cytochrome c1 subunit|nr:cytochrome c1 [Methylococcales bacterium]MBT7445587.1 cytochrome c1 [Methylococcales bacterium]
MKRLLTLLFCLSVSAGVQASGGGNYDHAPVDLHNKTSLQNGAKVYVNYCLGCHGLRFLRYNQMAEGIGATEAEVKEKLMFVGTKIGEQMNVSASTEMQTKWFGTNPPDLSLVARSWGPDKLYTYLRSFYVDPSRPMGVNNTVFKDVGMPHVLVGLQGKQKIVYKDVKSMEKQEDGSMKEVVRQEFDKFELVSVGELTPEEYDATVGDLVNFLTFVGEPHQLDRKSLGIKVILFLMVLFVLAYLMKKEFWKDLH